jgi:murein DD-endopeptidase MepM/ murein hydrolase activator NlpD
MPTSSPEPTDTPSPHHLITPSPHHLITPSDVPIAPHHLITPSSDVPIAPHPCPDPPPEKPEYQHNILSPQAWPTPDTAVPQPHFWLIDPVQGGRKPLANGYYPYGWDGDGRFLLHNGADMPQDLGTLLLAAATGTVVVAGSDAEALYGWRCDWYGQLVIIELAETWQGQPVYLLYGHIRNIQVEVGERVQPGQVIAEIGVEGVSAVPHLHLEIRIGSNDFAATRNPMLWLAPLPDTGVVAGRLVDGEGRPWQGTRITLISGSGDEPQYLYTFTYLDDPQHLIHPDEGLAENFVFADLPPGRYTLFASLEGVEYRQPLEVRAGEVTVAEVVSEQ